MRRLVMMLFLVALASGELTAPAQAQYRYDDRYDDRYVDCYDDRYGDTPLPYYEEEEPRRGYRALPPRAERDLGQRCRVRLRTDIGRTRYVCPIVRARVVGRPCVCPPPRGYGPGPYLDGIVIN